MLSKPMRDNDETRCKKHTMEKPMIDYHDFYNKKMHLKSYKVPELKCIAKHHRLHITGTKGVLIERIENLFQKMKNAEKIQRIFRGWLVRFSFKIRGEAFKDRSLCVNDTDFCTLEPIDEIPFEYFYSYRDEKDFIYGFNISSLIQLFKKNQKLENPYNRERIDRQKICQILFLNNIIPILFGEKQENHIKIIQERATNNNMTNISHGLSVHYYRPRIILSYSEMNTNLRTNLHKIISSRNMPMSRRIQELFIEIDRLGNYTQSVWYTSLGQTEYMRFYRILFDIWQYRGQIPQNVKNKICPFIQPFANIFSHHNNHTEFSLEQIQILCTTVMENLIYSGIDEEYRKIGTLHVLSALTIVSRSARTAMPWLFESIVY
jgi:hypothetical protein